MRSWAFCALAALALLSFVPRAGAWTNAHVRDVRARVEVDAQGKALVTLDVGVEVLGGWLERLELAGFDEDLQLAANEPAWLVSEAGERVSPVVRAEEGTIDLRFEKSLAPRRGVHRVGVRYTTVLAARAIRENGGLRVAWTLPGWEAGLSTSEITLVGPAASLPVQDDGVAQEIASELLGSRRAVRFVRVHVPRSSPWTVAIDVPSGMLAADAASGAVKSSKPPVPRRGLWTGALIAAWVLVIGLLARRHARREAARIGLSSVSAWPSRLSPTRSSCALALAAALAWPYALWLSLALLLSLGIVLLERAHGGSQAMALGHFEPIGKQDLARMVRATWWQRLGFAPWADLTTCVGALGALLPVSAGLLSAGALDPAGPAWGLGGLCALVSWAGSSRLRRPKTLAQRVTLLLRACRHTLSLSCAFRLVWYVTDGAEAAEPRLRVTPAARYAGLLRTEIIADSRRGSSPLLLSVVTEAGSATERFLQAAWHDAVREQSQGGARVLYLRAIDGDVGSALEALFGALTAESQRAVEQALDARRWAQGSEAAAPTTAVA